MKLGFVAMIIVVSLLAMGVFGFLGLAFMEHSELSSCPVSLLSGGDCPPAGGSMALAFHHISGLQNLTQFVVNLDTSLLALFTLLVFVFLIFPKFLQTTPQLQAISFKRYDGVIGFIVFLKKQLLRWLVLRHKRDPHIFLWVYA